MRTCPEGSLQVKLMVHRATAVAGHHTKPQLLEPRSTRSPHCRLAAELAADHDAAWFFHFGFLNHFSYQYRIFPTAKGIFAPRDSVTFPLHAHGQRRVERQFPRIEPSGGRQNAVPL